MASRDPAQSGSRSSDGPGVLSRAAGSLRVRHSRAPALVAAFVVELIGAAPVYASPDVTGSSARGGGTVTVPTRTIAAKALECAALFRGAGGSDSVGNLWESAKLPALSSHCSRLQLGVDAFRDGNFKAAMEYAARADADTPGQPGPWVVRGESLSRWGKYPGAIEAFAKARALSPRALDDAEALDDYGVALVRVGDLPAARAAYRALLPRVGGTSGLCGIRLQCESAALAYLTAAAIAMEGGRANLDEAIAIMREARVNGDTQRDVRRATGLALAIALDRRGDGDQARELATEVVKSRGMPNELPAELRVRLVAPEEWVAMRALALESTDARAALEAWRLYLESGGGKRAWAEHARSHIHRLEAAGTGKLPSRPARSK